MKTPIVDFVKNYIESGATRFHMPGHKGESLLGCEGLDITEISGADVLCEAQGIIGESEANASALFGTAHSFFVTQGSTTAICAMLALVKAAEGRTTVLAARNVHKAFVNACALLDINAKWVMPEDGTGILECKITAENVEENLKKSPDISAVYLTSPDYLGNIQDIQGISKVCKKYGVLLLVDNAHGAYLKFLDESIHPIDMGADICCDSAHKTLPVLTGGAYLHVSGSAPRGFLENARRKIALFSSTSPSYLILQSLDLCNKYIADGYKEKLKSCIAEIEMIKEYANEKGFVIKVSEPLKIVFDSAASGYSGYELAEIMRKYDIEAEFCDRDFVVLMATASNTQKDYERLKRFLAEAEPKKSLIYPKLNLPVSIQRMSVRQAVFAESEIIEVKNAIGRICAELTVSCSPAVPIAVSGEEITPAVAEIFEYYGTKTVSVVK